jgi:hypothetical protein
MMKRIRSVIILVLLAIVQSGSVMARMQEPAPADVRALIEGSWQLEEWHLDGHVLRPPEIGGRRNDRDGVVVAIYQRSGPRGFESFAGYGTYRMDASSWTYGYERIENARGTSAADAKVTITQMAQTTYKLYREGAKIVVERPNDRREYEGDTFTFISNGKILRKYIRVR